MTTLIAEETNSNTTTPTRTKSNSNKDWNSTRNRLIKIVTSPISRKATNVRKRSIKYQVVPEMLPSRPSNAFTSPAFKLRAFHTTTSSSTDGIVLYTNAIRHSTNNLFCILYSLHERRYNNLQMGDLSSFFIWFKDYHTFFCNFISLMNDVFLPSLREVVPFRNTTPPYFSEEGQRLNRIVHKTFTTANLKFNNIENQQDEQQVVSNKLVKHVDKLIHIYCIIFAQSLCSYLYSLEKYCTAVYSRFCSIQTSMLISKNMANALKQMPNFHRSLPLLLRWLQHRPQTTAKWLSTHYDYITIRLYRIWRRPTEHEHTLHYFKLITDIDIPR